jgi:hypothetical protein
VLKVLKAAWAQESYEVMKALLGAGVRAAMETLTRDALDVCGIHFTFEFATFGDLKMQLMLYGRGAASSTYPCLWCWVKSTDGELLKSITTDVDKYDISFDQMPTVQKMADNYDERVRNNYIDDSDDWRSGSQKNPPLININPCRCAPEKLHLELRPCDKFDEIHEGMRKVQKINDTEYQRLLRRLHVFKGNLGSHCLVFFLSFNSWMASLCGNHLCSNHGIHWWRMHEAAQEGERLCVVGAGSSSGAAATSLYDSVS